MPAHFEQHEGAIGGLSVMKSQPQVTVASGWPYGHPPAQEGTRDVQRHQWHKKLQEKLHQDAAEQRHAQLRSPECNALAKRAWLLGSDGPACLSPTAQP